MALTTPRFAIPYPVAADANDVPASMLAMATLLDNKMMTYGQGPLASRPAAGTSNRVWFATDTKDYSYDTGVLWRSLTGSPTIGVARYWQNTNPASSSAFAVIAWNQTSFNRNGTPAAATKIVVPSAGYWRIHALQRFNVSGAGAGNCAVQIRKGPNSDTAGTAIAYAQESAEWTLAFDNDITVGCTTVQQFAAGDDFAVWHACGTGGTLYGSAIESYVEYELLTVT